jgi:hypothetical protein
MGQPEQDKQNRTASTAQDCQNNNTGTGQQEKDSRNRAARIAFPGQTVRKGQQKK